MTLVEILVVLALMAIILAAAAPALRSVLSLQQRDEAVRLVQTLTWLRDEAALRNTSFRIVFNLDRGTWKVQVGDPGALVFSSPEKRQEFEDDLKSEMKRYTQRELDEGKAAELQAKEGSFMDLEDEPAFTTAQTLPDSVRFGFVYTPAYGPSGLEPHSEPPEDPEDDNIATATVFPNGTTEHLVIRLVDADDPEEGYTIETEPLTGKVTLTDELVDPTATLSWLPTEGPSIE